MLWPPCLSGVSIVQSIPVDVCAAAVIDATCYKKMCQRDSLWHDRKTPQQHFEVYFLRPMKYLRCQWLYVRVWGFFCNVVLALLSAIFRQYCTSAEVLVVKWTVSIKSKNTHSAEQQPLWLIHYYILHYYIFNTDALCLLWAAFYCWSWLRWCYFLFKVTLYTTSIYTSNLASGSQPRGFAPVGHMINLGLGED